MKTRLEELVQEMVAITAENSTLRENMNDMAMRLNEANWELLGMYKDDEGISLDNLKRVTETLRDMMTNPLIKRGDQLRTAYVFGRGITLPAKIPPRVRAKMDHPYNRATLFSPRAWEELSRALYTDGNLFITRNTKTDVTTRIPLNQITDFEYDPDSAERIWHIQRTWSIKGEEKVRWYPMNTYSGPKRATINRQPVDNDSVIYHEAVNKQVGWALGIPDGFAAMAWAMAYSEYIKNNATLVRAYSQLAFKVQQKTAGGVQQAAAAVSSGGVGGSAIYGAGSDIAALPASGSQVDFGNGRPIASLVASALGVSVVALLSDPGAAGSSYGAAQTLDFPTIRVMSMAQASWILFFTQMLRDFGMKGDDFEVTFPSIETDAIYRQITTLVASFTTGAINQREYRAAVLAILDIPEPDAIDKLPLPSEFTVPSNYVSPEDEEAMNDPVASQGNTGSVPGGTNHDKNANRDDDAAASQGGA